MKLLEAQHKNIGAIKRSALVRKAFHLEFLTTSWMVIEAVVAIGSGFTASSLLLIASGIDSLIELASAGVLIWRLDIELRRGEVFADRARSGPRRHD